MTHRRVFFASLLVTAASLGVAGGTAQSVDGRNGVPASLLAHLTNGVNITRWFCYTEPGTDTDRMQNYLGAEDFANLKKIKTRFVRLCLGPEVVVGPEGGLRPGVQPFVDKAVSKFIGADMAVLYDLHDNGTMKLDTPKHDNGDFIRFWQATATHFKGKHEKMLVFELVNEPVFNNNPQTWFELQASAVKAIRAIDPERTILASPTGYSSPDQLAALKPLAATNILYTWHCYDPFYFTHQGATWAGEDVKHLKNMPFPSSPTAVQAMLGTIEPAYKDKVTWYGNQHFDADYLRSRLEIGVEWGKVHHVPIILGEFGAYPIVSPPESRARWFEAMSSVTRELHVRRCLWGYDDGFGLGRVKDPDGTVKLDQVVLKALFGIEE